ncbi:MAG: class I SAM-dependent methyltransferase [Bdellovibrionota bacterium]
MQRRAYYDAEPWYQKEKTQDWYKQKEKTNEAMKEALQEYISPKLSVLEVGCGGGWLAEHLLKAGIRQYAGFDYAETAVTNARARLGAYEDARIWRSDALLPQNYTKKYNLVLAHQFLQCLVGPDRAKWLKLCKSAINPAGVLLIGTTIGIPETIAATVDPQTKLNKRGNRYYADEEEIKAEIIAAGFELEEVIHPEKNSAIFVAGPQIS